MKAHFRSLISLSLGSEVALDWLDALPAAGESVDTPRSVHAHHTCADSLVHATKSPDSPTMTDTMLFCFAFGLPRELCAQVFEQEGRYHDAVHWSQVNP